jgi:uncharacterized membrane protein
VSTPAAHDLRLCVLLACFVGRKRASKVRRAIGKRLDEGGDRILDEVVLSVNSKRKVQVHDPRRTMAAALTAALTWGIFGLITGGLEALGLWAVLGAICAGLYAYLVLHRLTKDERRRIGEHLPPDSSALAAFVEGSDPERILGSVAPSGPAVASVAAIGSNLSARVLRGPDDPTDSGDGQGTRSPGRTQLSMLLVRFAGQRSARKALATTGAGKGGEADAPEVELVVEADERGKRRVIDPKLGSAAFARSDAVSWGGFGLVYGVLVGFAGDGGVLSGALDRGLETAIAWGLFGLGAGALMGLWAGRRFSARRLKGIGPLVAPDSSMALGWAGGSASPAAIDEWSASGSERVIVRFVTGEHGALLDVATS